MWFFHRRSKDRKRECSNVCIGTSDARAGRRYQAKEFEYRVTGAMTYPAKETLFAFLDAIILDAIIPKIEPVAYQALPSK